MRWSLLASASASASAALVAGCHSDAPVVRPPAQQPMIVQAPSRYEDKATFEKACEADDTAACLHLFLLYEFGREGTPQDSAKALSIVERSCLAKNEYMCMKAIHVLTKRGDIERAEALYRANMCSEPGPSCEGKLAKAYADSHLFSYVDDREGHAKAIYERACSPASPQVCLEYAALLARSGEKAELQRALGIFDDECTRGSAQACFSAGQIAAEKPAVEDGARAEASFARACKVDVDCELQAASSFARGADLVRAEKILAPSCKAGRTDACVSWGHVLVEQKQFAKAKALYEDACDTHNEPRGCTALGGLYAAGLGVPKDAVRAKDLVDRACKSGDPSACPFSDSVDALGKIFIDGLGGTFVLIAEVMFLWPLEGLARLLAASKN